MFHIHIVYKEYTLKGYKEKISQTTKIVLKHALPLAMDHLNIEPLRFFTVKIDVIS